MYGFYYFLSIISLAFYAKRFGLERKLLFKDIKIKFIIIILTQYVTYLFVLCSHNVCRSILILLDVDVLAAGHTVASRIGNPQPYKIPEQGEAPSNEAAAARPPANGDNKPGNFHSSIVRSFCETSLPKLS